MTITFADAIALLASLGVWWRFANFYFIKGADHAKVQADSRRVSIVVPARNEQQNLRTLLPTLQALHPLEIIVIDDSSTDRTAEVVREFHAVVESPPPRPPDWVAKSWACMHGAGIAKGDIILFTDADTVHRRNSLTRALCDFDEQRLQMLSASPWFLNGLWWERLLGPFYCFVYAGASPFDQPRPDRAFAVGQYILVDKTFYNGMDGHTAVKNAVAEDAALAQALMKRNGRFNMYKGSPLYDVQMYTHFTDFTQGWTRQLRMGMRQVHAPPPGSADDDRGATQEYVPTGPGLA